MVGHYCFTTSPVVTTKLFSRKLAYERTGAFEKAVEDKNQ